MSRQRTLRVGALVLFLLVAPVASSLGTPVLSTAGATSTLTGLTNTSTNATNATNGTLDNATSTLTGTTDSASSAATSTPIPVPTLTTTSSVSVSGTTSTPVLTTGANVAVTTQYMVGFQGPIFPTAAFQALGMTVSHVYTSAGFAVVGTADPGLLQTIAETMPTITYAVVDGVTAADSSQWDSAQWDSAQWDGATWDGATWDGATWDSAQWDGATWDGATWDGATWDGAQWDGTHWDAGRDGSLAKDPGFLAEWQLGATHAPDAWNTTTGSHTVTLCVVDSGVDYNHPDLAANMRRLSDGTYGYDFVNGDKDPMDDGGHGTMMAGIAAGVMGNGRGIAGLAQTSIVAAKVLDANGAGVESNLALAIRWCYDTAKANIVSMSLHISQDNPGVHDAIKYVRGKGLFVVAASGNDGKVCDSCVAYPAAYNEAESVGASMPNGTRAPFSNGGKQLDIMAPGVAIVGPWPGGKYAVGAGTSHATAVAAGAAALILAAKPGLSPQDVASALNDNAKRGPDGERSWSYGFGYLRLDRTFQALGVYR